jgi:hypothetical protein
MPQLSEEEAKARSLGLALLDASRAYEGFMIPTWEGLLRKRRFPPHRRAIIGLASSFAPPTTAPSGTVMTGYRGLDVCCTGSPPRPARAAPRPVPVAQVQPADTAGHRPRA